MGQDVTLTCDSFSIPLPEKDIIWSFKKNKIMENDRYKITKAAKVDGVVSSLLIKKAIASDFGDYECSINNGIGEDTLTLKLDRVGKDT